MENLKRQSVSWPVIIIALVIFWPIGCVLLYSRIVLKNGKLKANGILLIVVAICCYIMAIAGFSITIEDVNTDLITNVVLTIVFLVAGVVSTVFSVKLLKKYKSYKKYVDKIGPRIKISIDELAQQTGDSIEQTIKNVSDVIKYKMIDAYINEYDEVIIKTNNMYENSCTRVEEKREIINVQCKNCGANNKYIKGKENRCEFCDSVLTKQYSNSTK